MSAVEEFKNAESPRIVQALGTFTPESTTERASYTVSGGINARCYDGRIVNALEAELRVLAGEKHSIINNKYNDLVLVDRHQRPRALFEVKTGAGLTDIYSAIGQLMYHTADLRPPLARRRAPGGPVPRGPFPPQAPRLACLHYSWERRRPIFPDLARLLRRVFRS